MKTCLHCGETFTREFDGAIGSIVNYGKPNAFLGNICIGKNYFN